MTRSCLPMLVALAALALPVGAQEAEPAVEGQASAAPAAPDAEALLVERIEVLVNGRGRTHPDSVRRLMNTHTGGLLEPLSLGHDLQRLRATGIFSDVAAQTETIPGGGERIILRLKDRWSLLPLFGLRRGGGRTTAKVGISDHNAFGRLFSLYGEVSSNADIPFIQSSSGDRLGTFFYALVPRLLGSRLSPALYWTREFLDFSHYRTLSAIGSIYDRAHQQLRAELRDDLTDLVSLSWGASFTDDRYTASDRSPAPALVPPGGRTIALSLAVRAGLVQEIVSMNEGTQVELLLEGSGKGLLGSDFGALSLSASVRSFHQLRPGQDLCLQLVLQATTGEGETQLFRAGGLRDVRGFPDAFFSGQQVLRANVEYRVDVLRTDLLLDTVWQVAAFADGGAVGTRGRALAGYDYTGPFASAGGGLRLIFAAFARAVARIDLAASLHPRRSFDIALGGQQFF